MDSINIFWFRRDLRLHDNHGLYRALLSGLPVLLVFIFDSNILSELPDKNDARVHFIHTELQAIHKRLRERGTGIYVFCGTPKQAWKHITEMFRVNQIFYNRDYEPYAKQRDSEISGYLKSKSIAVESFKDQLIFEPGDVLKQDGDPYIVYTPYRNLWIEQFKQKSGWMGKGEISSQYPSENHLSNMYMYDSPEFPALSDLGFKSSERDFPDKEVSEFIIQNYAKNRDQLAKDGTSRLGVHLRFGTISIRNLVQRVCQLSEIYLHQLIWREFYFQILDHFPHVVEYSFRKKYDRIEWRNNQEEFKKWCEGKTGYPIVDAGMRELNGTGYMHNRARMVTASFLCKHLLIDWRWGEAYFARKLLDFELANNNGGWQWCAGSGTDAAPYFRIFNPMLQQKKFDPDEKYIKKWVPEYNTGSYPAPIVDHKMARERCLSVYKKVLG